MLLDILRPYIIAFVPIFVVVDIIGSIPTFLTLGEKFSHKQKRRIVQESILYAFFLIIIIVLCARYLLGFIGITSADFKIAGGIFLIVISINLLLSRQVHAPHDKKRHIVDLGIFPLTTPLIAKPAVFVIVLVILEELGFLITLIALFFNLLISYVVLKKSLVIFNLIGERGIKAFSKILEIIILAVSIMMIRQGVVEIFIISKEVAR